jgi:hypothetical protein
MELLDDVGQVEGRFDSLGEGVKLSEKLQVCAECTMGKEIILGVPDGTPR